MKKNLLLLAFGFLFSSLIFCQETDPLKSIDILLYEGKFNEAIDSLNILEKKDSLNSSLFLKLGLAYQGLFKHNKAKEVLSKSVRLDSANTTAYKALGFSYSSLGLLTPAESMYRKAVSLDTANIPIAISLCKILQENNNYSDAAVFYQKLIDQDSTNSIFHRSKAFCLMKLQQDSLAIISYKNSFKYNPENLTTLVSLGHLFYKSEKPDSALYYINIGLSKNMRHPVLNRLKADIHLSRKEYFEAVHNYGKSIAFGDSTYQNYQKLGLSYYFIASSSIFRNKDERNKKYMTCIDAFMKSYKINSQDQLTCMYLGVVYKETENYEKAEQFLHQSLSCIFPDYLGDIYYQLADTYYKNNKFAKAVQMSKKSVEHSPGKFIYVYTLATICDKYYKDKKIALKYYERFLENSGDMDEKLIEYSKDRILSIKEKLHFEGRL